MLAEILFYPLAVLLWGGVWFGVPTFSNFLWERPFYPERNDCIVGLVVGSVSLAPFLWIDWGVIAHLYAAAPSSILVANIFVFGGARDWRKRDYHRLASVVFGVFLGAWQTFAIVLLFDQMTVVSGSIFILILGGVVSLILGFFGALLSMVFLALGASFWTPGLLALNAIFSAGRGRLRY